MNEKLMAELLLEIKKLNTLLQNQQPQTQIEEPEWATASDAYELLKSPRIKSPAALKRLRLEGVLSESRGEIRDISKGDIPRWEYNIPKCRAAIKAYFDRLSA